MAKTDGKSREQEMVGLDLEHELPQADGDDSTDGGRPSSEASGAGSSRENELQKVKAERDTLLDRLARMQAEFENARRRASKEQQDYRDYATMDAIKSLLPALDSFQRALQVQSDPADFRSGVELIYKQLQDALAKLGVTAIAAKGEPFDPRFHEAIEMVETSDAPDHEVLEELQRGYKLKDRLVRPAMVKVASNPSANR
jgi:molecular chaperone GrpE